MSGRARAQRGLAVSQLLALRSGGVGCRITSSCSGRSDAITVAPRARHFTLRSRRSAEVSAPPLNCGVSRQTMRLALLIVGCCGIGAAGPCRPQDTTLPAESSFITKLADEA